MYYTINKPFQKREVTFFFCGHFTTCFDTFSSRTFSDKYFDTFFMWSIKIAAQLYIFKKDVWLKGVPKKITINIIINQISLLFTACDIISVKDNAFRGLENTLQSLNLATNSLRSVPVVPLRTLRLLSQLDLSDNKITYIPENAFVTLRLKTLKLADNNVTITDNALRGLETSLKNLNLKGCQLKDIPNAVRDLKGLAFLDLAQNVLKTLQPGVLQRLDSLTALNLERNVIQKLHRHVFDGVNDTLSSLSLLNNLLTEFPLEAIRSLTQLRVRIFGLLLFSS